MKPKISLVNNNMLGRLIYIAFPRQTANSYRMIEIRPRSKKTCENTPCEEKGIIHIIQHHESKRVFTNAYCKKCFNRIMTEGLERLLKEVLGE